MLQIFTALVGWRTVLFNVIMFALAYAKNQGWITAVPDKGVIDAFVNILLEHIPYIIAGGNVVLRAMTKTPIGTKPS